MADVIIRIKQLVEGSGETRKVGKDLENLVTQLKNASAGAVAYAATMKKAFDLGREGASLIQIERSFERLNNEVFKTPALLDDMRNATAGTVRDVDLMSSALTLTAGTTGDMSQALARATPLIAEMAKAANAINPALGSTTFLMDSLSIAAKRQSRLLADNAGIIIRMESAVKQVHPALQDLARTYAELPEELRFLNEMLFQGENLITQAGDAAISATDSWDRFTVQTQEITDTFKRWLAEGLTPVIQQMNGDYNTALDGIIDKQLEMADSVEGLIEVGKRLAAIPYFQQWLTGTLYAVQEGEEGVVRALAGMSGSAEEFQKNLQAAFGDRAYIDAFDFQIASLPQVEALYAELTRETKLHTAAQEEDRRTFQEWQGEISDVSDALLTYEQRREGIITQEGIAARLEREAEEARDLASALREAKGALEGLYASQRGRGLRTATEELTGVARAAANAAEGAGGFLTEAFEESARAAEEAQRAIDSYWSSIESITSGALGSQFNLIDNIGDTRDEIARLRDEVEANPDDVGLVNELERAIDRFHELTGQASESWEDMVLDIITETGGFDRVAADFAVAAGIMTQAQADAQLGAVQMAEALQNIGLAVDQGAITPDQGAELFNTLMSGADDAGAAIAEAQGMLDALTGGGIDLGASAETGGLPPQLAGAIEGTTALDDALTAVQDSAYLVTVDDTQVTAAIDHVTALQEALLTVGGTTATVNIPPMVGGGIGHAQGTGGWRTVPAGFPNDTYPAFLSSGETYNVVPAGQQAGGGQHIDARTYIVANTRETMALAMSSAGEARKRRGDSYMGRR